MISNCDAARPSATSPRGRRLCRRVAAVSRGSHDLPGVALPGPDLPPPSSAEVGPAVDVLMVDKRCLQAGESARFGLLIDPQDGDTGDGEVGGRPVQVHAVAGAADPVVVNDASEPGLDCDRPVAELDAQGLQLVHQAAHVLLDRAGAGLAADEVTADPVGEFAPVEVKG